MSNEPYTVTQIDSESWMISEGFVRAFLLQGERYALLIDTGTGLGNIAEVVRQYTQRPVILVNTHADKDHIGGNHYFSTAFLHPAEFAYYRENTKGGDARPQAVWDGHIFDLGNRHVQVVLLPGHTPGSIVLIDLERHYLFSADNLTTGSVFMFGEIRDIQAYICSMERLSTLSNKFKYIFPSHGSLNIGKTQIEKQLACAQAIVEKRAEEQNAPAGIPAKQYSFGGASFYYNY